MKRETLVSLEREGTLNTPRGRSIQNRMRVHARKSTEKITEARAQLNLAKRALEAATIEYTKRLAHMKSICDHPVVQQELCTGYSTDTSENNCHASVSLMCGCCKTQLESDWSPSRE